MGLEDAAHEVDGAFTRDDLKGPGMENTFAGATSFLRRRYTKDLSGVDIAVTGIAFDQAVTNRPGCRFGPRAIREASALQPYDPPYGWDFDVLSEFAIADYGDMAFDYARPDLVPGLIGTHAATILKAAKGMVTLGGDHSITLPLLRAHAARFGPLALIQFDAHSDSWPNPSPSRVDHGTFVYNAVEEGLLDVGRSVQVGLRTTNPDLRGISGIDARAVRLAGPEAIAARVRDIVGDAPVYLSFDIDALDPAFAPGTGTPVWGGISSIDAAIMLRDLAGVKLVGGDVVEVSPPFDHGGITAVAGAHVATELLCLWGAANRR